MPPAAVVLAQGGVWLLCYRRCHPVQCFGIGGGLAARGLRRRRRRLHRGSSGMNLPVVGEAVCLLLCCRCARRLPAWSQSVPPRSPVSRSTVARRMPWRAGKCGAGWGWGGGGSLTCSVKYCGGSGTEPVAIAISANASMMMSQTSEPQGVDKSRNCV